MTYESGVGRSGQDIIPIRVIVSIRNRVSGHNISSDGTENVDTGRTVTTIKV